MNKVALVAVALVLAPLASSSQEVQDRKDREPPYAWKSDAPGERAEDLLQPTFQNRAAQAIERVVDACATDIDDFCGRVSPGGGRVSLCMLAHEDQLSSACRSALHRVSLELRRSVDRVAEVCWNEIETLCGATGKIAQCVEQKKGSFSSSCRIIVGALGQKARRLMPLTGMFVYSSDNKTLGQVVEVIKGSDDKVQSIQVDIGRMLGLGTRVVTIAADKLERLPGIKVLLSEAEVRSLPEAKKQ